MSCSVSFGENEIWPIHNFKDDNLCFDSRLAVEKVDLGPDEQNHIEFEMRNFRFRDSNSIGKQDQGSSDFKLTQVMPMTNRLSDKSDKPSKEQTIVCSLMLDEQVATNDGPSCTCYSEDECGSVISSTTSAPTTSTTGDVESTTQPATMSESSNFIATTPDSDIEPTDDSAPTTVLATTTEMSILTTTSPENGDLEPTDGYEPTDANESTSREPTTTEQSTLWFTPTAPYEAPTSMSGVTTERFIPTSTTPVNELTFSETEFTVTTADTTTTVGTLTTARLLDFQ